MCLFLGISAISNPLKHKASILLVKTLLIWQRQVHTRPCQNSFRQNMPLTSSSTKCLTSFFQPKMFVPLHPPCVSTSEPPNLVCCGEKNKEKMYFGAPPKIQACANLFPVVVTAMLGCYSC